MGKKERMKKEARSAVAVAKADDDKALKLPINPLRLNVGKMVEQHDPADEVEIEIVEVRQGTANMANDCKMVNLRPTTSPVQNVEQVTKVWKVVDGESDVLFGEIVAGVFTEFPEGAVSIFEATEELHKTKSRSRRMRRRRKAVQKDMDVNAGGRYSSSNADIIVAAPSASSKKTEKKKVDLNVDLGKHLVPSTKVAEKKQTGDTEETEQDLSSNEYESNTLFSYPPRSLLTRGNEVIPTIQRVGKAKLGSQANKIKPSNIVQEDGESDGDDTTTCFVYNSFEDGKGDFSGMEFTIVKKTEDGAKAIPVERIKQGAKKIVEGLGLKKLTGFTRVNIRQSVSLMYVINNPVIYLDEVESCYLILGECSIELGSSLPQGAAVGSVQKLDSVLNDEIPKPIPTIVTNRTRPATDTSAKFDMLFAQLNQKYPTSTDGDVASSNDFTEQKNDDSHEQGYDIQEGDILVVMEQAQVTRSEAVRALRKRENIDYIALVIMDLDVLNHKVSATMSRRELVAYCLEIKRKLDESETGVNEKDILKVRETLKDFYTGGPPTPTRAQVVKALRKNKYNIVDAILELMDPFSILHA